MEAYNLMAPLNNPLLVKALIDKLPNNQKLNTKDGNDPVVKSLSD